MIDKDFWDLERTFDGFLVKAVYVDLAGDLVAGVLLGQIVYWNRPSKIGLSKLTVVRDGKLWLAKSRDSWAHECRISLSQYKRAVTSLVVRKLITTSLHLFRGVVCPHIYLNLGQLLYGLHWWKTTQSVGVYYTNALGDKEPIHWWESAQSYSTYTTAETTADSTTSGNKNSGTKNQDQEEYKMDAEDTLSKFKTLKPHGGTGLQALTMMWKSRCAILDFGFQKPLTKKEVGQLKLVHNVLGPETIQIVDYGLQNWEKFSQQVWAMKGVPQCLLPNTGFLLLHYEILVQLIAESSKAKSMPTVLTHAPVAKVPETVDNTEVASEADVLEALALVKGLKTE